MTASPSTPPTPPPQDTDRVAFDPAMFDRLIARLQTADATSGILQTQVAARAATDHIATLTAARDAAEKQYELLKDRVIRDESELQQTLGKALGYPWFKDDQKNFPGATEDNGVCVGEHVGLTLAMEAARALETAATWQARAERVEERVAKMTTAYRTLIDDYEKYNHGHASMPFSSFRLALCDFLEEMEAALTPAAPSGNASGGAMGGE